MKKKIIAVIIIILIATLAVFAFINTGKSKKESHPEEKLIEKTYDVKKLPQITAYSQSVKTGVLVGYTTEMDTSSFRNNLIVIGADDRNAKLTITNGDVKIEAASFAIRSNNGERLIDSGDVENIKDTSEETEIQIPVSEILESNKEYSLVITLETDKIEKIYYYSRIMVVDNDFVQEQAKFATEFSDKTLDESKATDLAIFLEPDDNLLNNNLGQITLSNNYDLLTWGNLSPKKKGDTQVCLKEVYVKDNGESGTYELSYQVEAKGNNEINDTYDVTETITVWTYQAQHYVLSYERNMNQVWAADDNTVNNTFIDLGIQSDTDVDFKQSKKADYVTYVVNNRLWLLDMNEKKFTNIYSVDSCQKDKTKVLTSAVDDDGNVDFIVCGYSMEPAHIGKNGISVCHYNKKDNSITEEIFLTYDDPVEILADQVGSLCYTNDNVLYLMIGHTVNYVNLKTKETGIIAENIESGNYAINSDKDTIAYNTNGTSYDSDSITIANLATGKTQVVKAGDGNKIRVWGYSGNNLVYGIAPASKVNKKGSISSFPMSKIVIMDSEGKEITSYEKNKIYITDVKIADSIINLKRISGNKQIDDDQLIDNTEKENVVAASSYYDDTKKYRELALSLKKSLNANTKYSLAKGVTNYIQAETIKLANEDKNKKLYYVYACGKLKEIALTESDAQANAKKYKGLVTDSTGEKIWTFEENYHN